MVQHSALFTAFLASSLSAASHSPQSTQCAGADNQDEVQLLQQQQVLSHPQVLQETLAVFGASLLQEGPDRQLFRQRADNAQSSAQTSSEMAMMKQTVQKLEEDILNLKSRKEALASEAARSADEERRHLANVSSYMDDFSIQASNREARLNNEVKEVEEQLSEETGLRQWAETRAEAAEAKELAAEQNSEALEATVSSAEAQAANATAKEEETEKNLDLKTEDLEQVIEQLNEAKEANAAEVAKANSHEKQNSDKAAKMVSQAKAEVVNVTALARSKVEMAQSKAADDEAKAVLVKEGGEDAVKAAKAQAQEKIAQARAEVVAEVKETHESLEKAEQMMQNWFTTNTSFPDTA